MLYIYTALENQGSPAYIPDFLKYIILLFQILCQNTEL